MRLFNVEPLEGANTRRNVKVLRFHQGFLYYVNASGAPGFSRVLQATQSIILYFFKNIIQSLNSVQTKSCVSSEIKNSRNVANPTPFSCFFFFCLTLDAVYVHLLYYQINKHYSIFYPCKFTCVFCTFVDCLLDYVACIPNPFVL